MFNRKLKARIAQLERELTDVDAKLAKERRNRLQHETRANFAERELESAKSAYLDVSARLARTFEDLSRYKAARARSNANLIPGGAPGKRKVAA